MTEDISGDLEVAGLENLRLSLRLGAAMQVLRLWSASEYFSQQDRDPVKDAAVLAGISGFPMPDSGFADALLRRARFERDEALGGMERDIAVSAPARRLARRMLAGQRALVAPCGVMTEARLGALIEDELGLLEVLGALRDVVSQPEKAAVEMVASAGRALDCLAGRRGSRVEDAGP